MESKILTRSYLETLSTQELLAIADDYGIDIPENLNRSFIITELIEVSLEFADEQKEDDITASDENAPVHAREEELPESYNETMICAVLRNPAWAYVYWDIKNADIQRLNSDSAFKGLCLRVSYWEKEEDEKPLESFDIQISLTDRQQYILISPEKNLLRVDLAALYSGKDDENLAVTPKIQIPKGSPLLTSLPGREVDLSPAVEASSMRNLLTEHFEKHRESFSQI
jgi:hypothetical protein